MKNAPIWPFVRKVYGKAAPNGLDFSRLAVARYALRASSRRVQSTPIPRRSSTRESSPPPCESNLESEIRVGRNPICQQDLASGESALSCFAPVFLSFGTTSSAATVAHRSQGPYEKVIEPRVIPTVTHIGPVTRLTNASSALWLSFSEIGSYFGPQQDHNLTDRLGTGTRKPSLQGLYKGRNSAVA